MHKLILAITFTASCGFAAGAVAQTTSVSTSSNATTSSTRSDQSNDVALGARQVPAPGSRDCIQDTGSHIRRRDQPCLPVNGNSYSREDLERTGDPNVGRALQQLDPQVQVSGGH